MLKWVTSCVFFLSPTDGFCVERPMENIHRLAGVGEHLFSDSTDSELGVVWEFSTLPGSWETKQGSQTDEDIEQQYIS